MSDSDYSRKRELECLRLASELTQLAAGTLNPHLKEHCRRMSKVWSRLAEETGADWIGLNTGLHSVVLH